jgi:hypothetical protein
MHVSIICFLTHLKLFYYRLEYGIMLLKVKTTSLVFSSITINTSITPF